MIDFLQNTPYLNIIFLLLALFGIILSIVFYLKSLRTKRPVYLIKSFNIIDNKQSNIEKLDISYDNMKVENLTFSKISFWNRGSEYIDKKDLTTIDPLRIEIDTKYNILDSKLSFIKKEPNNISIDLSKDKKSIFINFDYIAKNEGFIISLYHTGLSSENLKIYGAIKGVNKILPGEPKENFIQDTYLSFFDKHLDKINFKLIKWLIIGVLIPVVIPAAIVAVNIAIISRLFIKLPKEFQLEITK